MVWFSKEETRGERRLRLLDETTKHMCKAGDLKMKLFFRKLRADLGGYFWLPCPVCGEMFGGFEIGNGRVTMPDGSQKCCCKKCDFEAGQIEALNRKTVFLSPKAAKLVRT